MSNRSWQFGGVKAASAMRTCSIRHWPGRENLFAYGKPTLFDLAASYGLRPRENHPFIDGNKRVGFIAGGRLS